MPAAAPTSTPTGSPTRSRAAALPIEERRAAIVAAALPLFLAQGGAITSREIAQAAGIAEGTIFRVFADKNAVLDAIVDAALDPAPVEAAIAAIDPAEPFETRLVAAVDILRARVEYVFRVLSMASNSAEGGRVGASGRPRPELLELVRLFEREADRLRCSPAQAAHLLRGLTFAGTHSSFALDEPLTSEEIVSVLLDGIRRDGGARGGVARVLIRLIRSYLGQYRKLLVILLGLQLVQAMASLFLPTLNASIIDKGVLKGDTTYIWKLGGVMLVITLVQVGFSIAATFCGAKAAMSFGRDVRRDLFHKVTGFSAREVGEFGAPSLITRITNDVQQVQMLVLMACTLLIVAPITIVGGTILAIREDGPLSLILVVAIPFLLLSIGSVFFRMHPQFTLMQSRIDRVNQILREQITGMRVVRAFVREPAEKVRFESANHELTETALKTGRLMAFMFPTVMVTVNLSSAAAVWFGANRIGAGEMPLGALIAFLSYLIQILMAVMMGTFVISMAPRAQVCAVRIVDVLDTESSVVVADDPITELPRPASLELRNASFSFAGAEKAVLTDISFRVDAGETLAIIGSTGSGKSALLNLVVRLFDTTSGQVLVNGLDVRDIHPDALHHAIGLVPQKPFLFSGTVASNVRFGDPDADDSAVWRALEIAQARDFVAAMPGGIGARIAQGGTNVSGGQRQRLAIARALAHHPDIYLFDDSFSALDLATDARLRAALAPVVTDAVNVIVAQRVSTILQADRILVLEQGRQVGLGTHAELIETCTTYQEIVESQFVAQAEEVA